MYREASTLSIGGTRIYYETTGTGDPLVLLHGGFGSTEDFAPQVSELARHFAVFAFDRPGHGRSPDNNEPFTYQAMTECTIEFIEKLRLGPGSIIGWSDGGIVSLLLAISRPDLARRIVCMSANYNTKNFLSPESLEGLKAATPESFIQSFPIAKKYNSLSPDGPTHFPIVFEKTKRMWLNEPNIDPKQISKIKIPFLVMAGDRDMITPEHTLELFRLIPGAELCVVPGSSHFFLIEKPEFTARASLEFLLGQSRKG